MGKNRPVRMYCTKEFKMFIKQKALLHGYDKYPEFTRKVVNNPEMLISKPKEKKNNDFKRLF